MIVIFLMKYSWKIYCFEKQSRMCFCFSYSFMQELLLMLITSYYFLIWEIQGIPHFAFSNLFPLNLFRYRSLPTLASWSFFCKFLLFDLTFINNCLYLKETEKKYRTRRKVDFYLKIGGYMSIWSPIYIVFLMWKIFSSFIFTHIHPRIVCLLFFMIFVLFYFHNKRLYEQIVA